MNARIFTLRHSDIERCPRRSLSPEHYRDDGTCRCDAPTCAIHGRDCPYDCTRR